MQIKRCRICNKEIDRKAKNDLCRQCWKKQIQSKIVPSKQQLLNDITQLNSCEKIAEKYNKSVQSVRRWLRNYNLKIEKQKKNVYHCQTCDQWFDSYSKFQAHKKTHPHICKYCGEEFEDYHKLGNHMNSCELNPKKDQIEQKRMQKLKMGHKHTQQTKQLMSKLKKQYLTLHPQKHPWRSNTKFTSKPCEDLKQYLKNNGINFYPEYTDSEQFKGRLYSIDIAFPNQKLAIQVNGFQHYNSDGNLSFYFQARHELLENLGWEVIEVPCIVTYSKQFRESLLKLIKQNIDFKYDYTSLIQERKRKKHQQYICPICGGRKSKLSEFCVKCQNEKRGKDIPSKQQLIKDLKQLKSKEAIGRKYNKTSTAVRNWFKKYNI